MYKHGQEHGLEHHLEEWDALTEHCDGLSCDEVTEDVTRDDLPDPWDGDHNIEYWVWDGTRLIPATPEQRARIQEDERTQAAQRHLEQLQERERQEARSLVQRFATVKTWWEAHVRVRMDVTVLRLRSRLLSREAVWTDGVHVEQSSLPGTDAANSEQHPRF